MKKIICIALTLCLLSTLCLTVGAASPRLTDEAELLTSFEADELEDKLNEISARQGVDIVVVTVDSTDGKAPVDYADDWFDYNDYGEDGILLLISMEESDWHVSTTGYGITAVTDAGLEYMADRFVPLMSDGSFSEAFLTFADLCDEFLTQAKSGDPYDTHNLPKEPFDFGVNLILCLIIGLVAALIVTGSMKRKLKTVRQQARADEYVVPGSLQMTRSADLFLYSHLARTERSQSSGGSSTHVSSSGRTHGGGGGKF